MRHAIRGAGLGLLLVALACVPARAQTEVTLEPTMDTSLFSESGSESNGAGIHLFAGNTNQGDTRRALLAFDVASTVPAGATITSVTLTLNMSRTASGSGAHDVALHKVTKAWGEGSSDADGAEGRGATATEGDATWSHAVFSSTTWDDEGGDFEEDASATLSVDAVGSYTWTSTEELVEDVQGWLDDPDQNFGWIAIGNESASRTAKRFDSRESADAAIRPILTVSFNAATDVGEEDAPAFRLVSNYPNPFRSATTLRYELESAQHVRLDVFDALGRRVRTLVDAVQAPGSHDVVFDAGTLADGLYLWRLTAAGRNHYGRMVRVR